MKKSIIALFILLATVITFNAANAALPIKQTPATTEASTTEAKNGDVAQATEALPKAERHGLFNKIKSNAPFDGNGHNHSHNNKPGWPGIVAICCAGLGLFFGWLLIPAIVFGAIGVGRKYKNRGLALAGLLTGVLVIILAIIFVALFIALL